MKKTLWLAVSALSLTALGLVIAGLALGWFGEWFGPGAQAASNPPPTSAGADTVRVEVVQLTRLTTLQPARVEPMERVEVVAKVTGYLKAFGTDIDDKPIDTGSRLRPGQTLALLSVPELDKELELKKATFKQAVAAVKAAVAQQRQAEKDQERYQAELTYRDLELKRHEELFARQSITESHRDEIRNKHKAAVAALASAEAKITQAEAEWEVAKARVDVAKFDQERVAELVKYATVQVPSSPESQATLAGANAGVPPKDGPLYVVTHRWADPGTLLQPGTGSRRDAIVSLMRVDRVKVIVDLPESESARVEVGDKATFKALALPDQEFPGEVSRFASALDPQTLTMRVEIDLANPGGKPLYPNMYGTAKITLATSRGILMVPLRCVHKEGKARFVYCVTEGRAEKVPVTIGSDDGTQVEVLKGLDAKSQVVSQTRGVLKPGQAVAVDEAKGK